MNQYALPKQKVLVLHPGTQYSFNLVKELYERQLLQKFITGIAVTSPSWYYFLYKIVPQRFKKELSNRLINQVPSKFINCLPIIEIRALISFLLQKKSEEETFFLRNKKFQLCIKDVHLTAADVVIGFDTSSWIIAERCRKLNKPFILDVSIAHPLAKEKLFTVLREKYPLWKDQFMAKSPLLIEKELEEAEYATAVVVPSEFVRQTYIDNGIPAEKLFINPFGTNIKDFTSSHREVKKKEKIKFLFFGAYSARKGALFILKVWERFQFENAELIMAGYGNLPEGTTIPENVLLLGPVAKKDRQSLFSIAHVFVFPSFFEGFAQVQIEAAASGLPIIGTYNSGASEIVENGINGFVIETGNEDELSNAIQFFLTYPEQIKEMSKASQKKAESFTWDAYGDRWEQIIKTVAAQ